MRGTASRCPMPYLCENGARNNAFWCASQMHACLLTDKHWPRKAIVWATPMLPHAPLRSASCLIALIRTNCIRVMFVPSASPRRNLNRNNKYRVPSPCMHAFHTQIIARNTVCVVQHQCLHMPLSYLHIVSLPSSAPIASEQCLCHLPHLDET